MPSPLKVFHALLSDDQIAYLKLKAAHRHLSASAVLRELVEKDRALDARRERDRNRTTP